MIILKKYFKIIYLDTVLKRDLKVLTRKAEANDGLAQ
jgi:hypothetical protein